ncbi:MAG TPA: transporter [Vicinamibacterales bacterium]|nr:transporter [Vicinamibacterales bacterium]
MKNGRPGPLLFLAALLLSSLPAHAQQPDESIEPDRPDVTNGTHIVSPGLVQIEFGGMYTRDTAEQSGGTSPFTIRIGVADWIEARFGADGLTTQNGPDANGTSFGNIQVGAKLRLWADPGGAPVLSILPNINLPTADATKGLGSGDADYTIALLTGTDIRKRGHIDVNYGVGAIGAGQGRPHYVQHLISASISDAVTDRWNPYVEVFWFSRTDVDTSPETAIDTGVIYELGSHLALDGGVQFGVAGPASNFGVFGGISVVLGAERALNGRYRNVKPPKTRR